MQMTKRIRKTTLSPVPDFRALAGAILAGQTITAAAAAAGIGRAAVHTWLWMTSLFRAAYNRDCAELRRENVARLERLAAKAVDVLEAALEGGERESRNRTYGNGSACWRRRRWAVTTPPNWPTDAELQAVAHEAGMKQRALICGL